MNENVLSIIIPVYNEEKNISSILGKVSEIELIGGMQKAIILLKYQVPTLIKDL